MQLDRKDNHDMTALCLAVQGGHQEVVRLLLETGQVDVNFSDITGSTP